MIWTRQRQTNQLRSTLREFYPAALEVFDDWLDATLWPCWRSRRRRRRVGSCRRSKIAAALRRAAGNAASTNAPSRSKTALRAEQLAAPR